MHDAIRPEDKADVLSTVPGLTAEHLDAQLGELSQHLDAMFSASSMAWEQAPAQHYSIVAMVTGHGLKYCDQDCFAAWILCLREMYGEHTPIRAWPHLCSSGQVMLHVCAPMRHYDVYYALSGLFNVILCRDNEHGISMDGLLGEECVFLWSILSMPRILAHDNVMPLLVKVAQFMVRAYRRREFGENKRYDRLVMATEAETVLAKNLFSENAAATVLVQVLRGLDDSMAMAHQVSRPSEAASVA